jgi:co-chaperonin GroES (HSP10)
VGTIPSTEDCKPGIDPVEYNVLIAPEEAEAAYSMKRADGSTFELIKPDVTKESEDLAQMRGRLVAVSPLAFNYDTWPEEHIERRPKAGDAVLFAKYAGVLHKGDDGREYRLCKDKDVAAVIR